MAEEIFKRIFDKISKIPKDNFSPEQLDKLEKYINKGIVNLQKYNNADIEKEWLRLTVIGFLVILIAILYYVVHPVLYIERWNEQDEIRNKIIIETLKTIGLFTGAGLGVISIYFGYKRAVALENSAIAANKTAEANLQNARTAEDKQITERFSKAIEQLASEKIEVRLGGIYTLERIAKDSEKDYWTIMEVLTAFIRENAPLTQKNPKKNQKTFVDEYLNNKNEKGVLQRFGLDILEIPRLRLDIQETLTVIARRNAENDRGKQINLSNVNIAYANLKKANLKGVNLRGSNLTDVDLTDADLTDADLTDAKLANANLRNADLRKAQLVFAELPGAILTGADLRGANLVASDLRGVQPFSTKLDGANLKKAIIDGFLLTMINMTELESFE